MERWTGRVALVTGASKGIGREVAKEFVKVGMKVIGCARTTTNLEELGREVKDFKGKFVGMTCDLQKEDDIEKMFSQIKSEFGRIDVLVNNAGMMNKGPLLTGTNKHWREMLEVNVFALAVCTREAVQMMRDAGIDDGHIIHISSMSGHRLTSKNEHFYAATKYAVKAMTEGLRAELRELNTHIRVTAISPGNIGDTEIVEYGFRDFPDEVQGLSKRTYKWMDPKDIVDAVVYAVSAPPHVQIHDVLMLPTEQPR